MTREEFHLNKYLMYGASETRSKVSRRCWLSRS